VSLRIGVVKFVNVEKGYGFITPDGGGADVFFHITRYSGHIQFSELKPGMRVKYNDELNGDRVRATIVRYETPQTESGG